MAQFFIVFTTAVLVLTLTSCQVIQDVAVDDSNCPVGPGVNRKTIKIGTEATCRCVVTKQGNSSTQARWFRQDNTTVGAVNETDGSTVLTFSYNASDPDQKFECRQHYLHNITPNAEGVTYTPQFRRDYLFINKHSFTSFDVPVSSNVNNITWQVGNMGGNMVNISECSFKHNNCTDFMPKFYETYIDNIENYTSLIIIKSKPNETQFSYVADNGERSEITELEFYAWPRIVVCSHRTALTYAEVTCNTSNVYPSAFATLHRVERDFDNSDFEQNYTQCINGEYGSGELRDYAASCTFRIKMKSMLLENNTITVVMYPHVSNMSKIEDARQNGYDRIIYFAPSVQLDYDQCASLFGDVIPKGPIAKCRCKMVIPNFTSGQARWYTKDDQVVGVENEADKSSTLSFQYNATDPHPTYTCRPFTELPGPVEGVTYKPKFSSSMPQSIITGFQPLLVLFGIVLSVISSR